MVLTNGFITAQTAFCHCTFSIYHCTFCVSLCIKKCPGLDSWPSTARWSPESFILPTWNKRLDKALCCALHAAASPITSSHKSHWHTHDAALVTTDITALSKQLAIVPHRNWTTLTNIHSETDWIGLCSVLRPLQHSIGYMGDGFYRSKDPTNGIKVLKENLQKTNQTTETTQNTHIDNNKHKTIYTHKAQQVP